MVLVTAQDAAEILDVAVRTVYDLARRGELTRHGGRWTRRTYDHAEVEALSLRRLSRARPRQHSYWTSVSEAAAELGVTPSAVRQRLIADRFPYVTAPNGRRYVRRHQLEVIANVWESRAIEAAAEPPRSR